MKRMFTGVAVAVIAFAGSTLPVQNAFAQGASQAQASKALTVGDDAPNFMVEKILKGDAINGFEKGKVYVVEFWATWCGPCIAAMPHLSEMQASYKDKGVRFVGVNIWEDKQYNSDTFEKVKAFVEKQGDRMAYTVAYDGSAGHMDKNFMQAAGRNGIPSAFIVNQDGKIAWMGHPMSMDGPLSQIVAGTYNMETIKKVESLKKQFRMQIRSKDWAGVEATLAEMTPLSKGDALEGSMQYFGELVENDTARAQSWGRNATTTVFKDNPDFLNAYAWTIVDPQGPIQDGRDVDAALAAAVRANELTKNANPAIMDTVARAYWLKGDAGKAIEVQTSAIEKAKVEVEKGDAPESMVEDLANTLKQYQTGKAPK